MNPTSLRDLLRDLAGAGRTGALHVDGTPGGVIYLVEGHLSYAESPVRPGVGERLVASGRLSAATWKAAYQEGHAEHRVGRTLIRDGHLGQHELAGRVMSTICDAMHALLQTGDGPVRFVPGQRHWLGVITRIELSALIQGTAKRRRAGPSPRNERELPWAGRPHPAWPRRTLSRWPDHAALEQIRGAVKQAI